MVVVVAVVVVVVVVILFEGVLLLHKPRHLGPGACESRFRGESETAFPDKSGWRGAVAGYLDKKSGISDGEELGRKTPFWGTKMDQISSKNHPKCGSNPIKNVSPKEPFHSLHCS